MKRNFVATVKERDIGQPLFILLELHEDIGLNNKLVYLNLPEGTEIGEAERIASILNENISTLGTLDGG